MAPEIILNKSHGMAVDWWALGIFLYEMHTGIDPFHDDNAIKIYMNIVADKFGYPKEFDPNLKSLVNHLLKSD